MIALTEPQVITQNGKPAFAVIPWDEYQALIENREDNDEADVWFPNEVVKANVRGDCLIKAWREYFKFTQAELAERASMTQSSLARLESGKVKPRKTTLAALADAMGINVEQLVES